MKNNPERLVGEFDAAKWATTFVALVKQDPEIASDEGTMLGWFANAIMAGYDYARRADDELRFNTEATSVAEWTLPYVSALQRQQ